MSSLRPSRVRVWSVCLYLVGGQIVVLESDLHLGPQGSISDSTISAPRFALNFSIRSGKPVCAGGQREWRTGCTLGQKPWILKRIPQRWLVDSHASHPLVFVHAFGTHHPNGGFRHLLKVLSRSYGKELY